MGFNVSIQPRLFPVPQTAFTSDDYWTPRWIFETLGLRFDLDVAAPPGGSPHVPADRYYTQADDGLAAPWFGRVWMNPPYSRASPWVDRFISHSNGVALLPHAKSKWHIRLFEQADAICAPTSGYFPFDSPRPGGVPFCYRCSLRRLALTAAKRSGGWGRFACENGTHIL